MYLFNNGATAWLGPATPGSSGTLQNSQCSINLATASVVGSGNNLTLTVPMTFTSAFKGLQQFFMRAEDAGGVSSGWKVGGTFTVSGAPTVVGVTPSSGAGTANTFAFTFADGFGYSALGSMYMQFSVNGVNANSCYLLYVRATNILSLMNDAGTSWGGWQNSQCSIVSPTISFSGNNLTLTLPITFTSAFGGWKQISMRAEDGSGASSGWQVGGSWTVQ